MPCSAVLYLGESFAEAGVVSAPAQIMSRRWYLGKEPLAKGLASSLKAAAQDPVTELVVASKSLSPILRRRLGANTAFLTTAGFEHWLEMNRPVRQSHFTVLAERSPSLLDTNLLFGISERTGSDGRIEKALEISDLEFLAAKLKLHNVEQVAVGFLNSHVNPQHEQMAGRYLRENGFNVVTSIECHTGVGEGPRWWAAVVNAYLGPRLKELHSELTKGLEDAAPVCQIKFLTPYGLIGVDDLRTPLASTFGPLVALAKWRQIRNLQSLLYLGLEDYWLVDGRWQENHLWRSDFGAVAATHPGYQRLELQSTQIIRQSFWGGAGVSDLEGGFEPGPMCFGKGITPQFLDVLWLQGRLEKIEGLSDRLTEKVKPRVSEILSAYSRSGQSGRPIALNELLQELEQRFAERIAAQLPSGNGEMGLCGPLADIFRPLLDPILQKLGARTQWLTDRATMIEALAQFTTAGSGEH